MTDADAGDPNAGYWSVLEPYWERIDIYSGPERFLATYSAAPEVQQVLFAAHFCESEVGNGGFHQFFSNPTGVLAPEAARAYRRLGLPDLAAIVEEAMAFWGNPYPRDQGERQDRLVRQPSKRREEWDPFVALDERFCAACGHHANGLYSGTRLYDALDAFAEGGWAAQR